MQVQVSFPCPAHLYVHSWRAGRLQSSARTGALTTTLGWRAVDQRAAVTLLEPLLGALSLVRLPEQVFPFFEPAPHWEKHGCIAYSCNHLPLTGSAPSTQEVILHIRPPSCCRSFVDIEIYSQLYIYIYMYPLFIHLHGLKLQPLV